MKAKIYALVLADYIKRIECQPPSVLRDDAALELMQKALRRGTSLSEADLLPSGPAEG